MAVETEVKNEHAARKKIKSGKSVPTEIITDILLRLSVESLLRCKSVCKLWHSLISNRYFVKSHLSLSSRRNDYAHHRLLLETIEGKELMSCSFSEVLFHKYVNNTLELDYPLKLSGNTVDVIGSCNGLLCIEINHHHEKLHSLFIWNPSTRRTKRIAPYACSSKIISYGFGYDELTDDYKLVVISYDFYNDIDINKKVQIYSLKTGNWKKIDECGHGFPLDPNGTLLNGVIHWISRSEGSDHHQMILCLDIAKETFGEVLLPVYGEEVDAPTLCTFGEMLCILCTPEYENSNTDVWVMKVYGAKDSWTKLYSIPSNVAGYGTYIDSAPFCCLNDGKAVLKFGKTSVLYDTKNTSYSKIQNFNEEAYVHTSFVESLVSPDSPTDLENNKYIRGMLIDAGISRFSFRKRL